MCIEKVGPHCEREVTQKLVHPEKTSITKHCCEKLVEMGEYCNANVVKDMLCTNPEIRSANATEVIERSKKIFHECRQGSGKS